MNDDPIKGLEISGTGRRRHDPSEFPTGDLPCQGVYGPCPNHNAARQRQNTAYVDDSQNWVTMCPECAAINANNWEEAWAEYWSGRL